MPEISDSELKAGVATIMARDRSETALSKIFVRWVGMAYRLPISCP